MALFSVEPIKTLVVNTSWLLGSEIFSKVSRLLVIFTLAASLHAVEYGVVTLALASHEIFKLIQKSGAGAQIIQCSNSRLKRYLENGIIIQWGLGLGLFLLQVVSSFILASLLQRPDLVVLLSSMAVVYLFYPLVSINVFLLQRNNHFRHYSIKNTACISIENFTIAISVLLDGGIYSIVIGKWAFLLSWLFCFSRRFCSDRFYIPKPRLCVKTLYELLASSAKILIGEFSRALKNQADIFAGANLLSPEAFGIYSFAKTAGVNLGQSLSSAFNTAIYPYLCEQMRSKNRSNWTLLIMLTLAVTVLFAIQALSVPIYVPILFTQPWQQEYFTISLLCLANVPITWVDTLCNHYRAQAKFELETSIRFISLLAACLFFYLWPSNDFYSHAKGLLVFNCALLIVFLLPFYQRINHLVLNLKILRSSHYDH